MSAGVVKRSGWRSPLARLFAPFPDRIPPAVRTSLIQLQFQRLHALAPLLCLTIAANAVAMSLAVMGDLPWWQQLIPPAILVGACLWQLAIWKPLKGPPQPDKAWRVLRRAPFVAAGLGLVSGVWTVNAFSETEQYACVVAPVFLALSALVSANCLTSVPRAATLAMATALSPIVVRMLIFDNLGMRCMAVMLVLIAVLQGRLIAAKFRETIKMLMLQHEITQLAEADALTGLKNRRAFSACLDERIAAGKQVTLAMIDLDGFKAANDAHGHHAGDAVLIEVAARMRTIGKSAICIARLGGDEFALLYDGGASERVQGEIAALRTVIDLPYQVEGERIAISASIGLGSTSADSDCPSALMQTADQALYREKGRRRDGGGRRAAA